MPFSQWLRQTKNIIIINGSAKKTYFACEGLTKDYELHWVFLLSIFDIYKRCNKALNPLKPFNKVTRCTKWLPAAPWECWWRRGDSGVFRAALSNIWRCSTTCKQSCLMGPLKKDGTVLHLCDFWTPNSECVWPCICMKLWRKSNSCSTLSF